MSLNYRERLERLLPLLRNFGVNPDKMSPIKLNELLNKFENINEVTDIDEKVTREISDLIGLCIQNKKKPIIRTSKIGRNDKCPCKSNKKFKKCCGRNKSSST